MASHCPMPPTRSVARAVSTVRRRCRAPSGLVPVPQHGALFGRHRSHRRVHCACTPSWRWLRSSSRRNSSRCSASGKPLSRRTRPRWRRRGHRLRAQTRRAGTVPTMATTGLSLRQRRWAATRPRNTTMRTTPTTHRQTRYGSSAASAARMRLRSAAAACCPRRYETERTLAPRSRCIVCDR